VGQFVLESVRLGKGPSEWTDEEAKRFKLYEQIGAARDPRIGMKSREIPGGTGPNAVAAALQAARQRLGEMEI
jgi:hypothetical protein